MKGTIMLGVKDRDEIQEARGEPNREGGGGEQRAKSRKVGGEEELEDIALGDGVDGGEGGEGDAEEEQIQEEGEHARPQLGQAVNQRVQHLLRQMPKMEGPQQHPQRRLPALVLPAAGELQRPPAERPVLVHARGEPLVAVGSRPSGWQCRDLIGKHRHRRQLLRMRIVGIRRHCLFGSRGRRRRRGGWR